MKKNYLFTLAMAAVISSASLAFGTTPAYESVIEGDHPVSFWPLNETTGTTIHDIVGSNPGTAENTSGLTFSVPGVQYMNGVTADTAMYFDSTNMGYIEVPYSSTLNTPQFTAEIWMKMPIFPVAGAISDMNPYSLNNAEPSEGWTFDIQLADASNPNVLGWLADNDWTVVNSGTAIQGQWSYYVMTYNGTTESVYTNGVLAGSKATGYLQVSAGASWPLLIGAYNEIGASDTFSRFFQGDIENVALYSSALTVAQITNHYYYGTNFNSSGPVTNPPSIATQPPSQTNYVGQTNTFTVSASGTAPLSYQWRVESGGVYANLSAGGQFSGVTNATLTISSLVLTNATNYDVVVTNAVGSVTSAPATLTVLSGTPAILTQPASQTNYVGQPATFTVSAGGTAPLSYQWQVESGGVYVNLSAGGQFSGVTNATLSISSLVLTNATNYDVVVTNSAGSITSAPAVLGVLTNPPSLSYQATILADSPVSFWPLKETTGTLIHDIAGTNNGTATASGLAYGVPGVLYSNGITSDTAIYFTNTSSAYISVPYSTNLNTPNFSVEVWLDMPTFPAAAQSANENPLTFGDGSSPTGWTFDIQVASSANPHMYGWCAENASLWNSGNSGIAIQGKWSYYAMTFNGTALTVYTNGVSAVVSNVPSYNMVSAGEYLYMGAYNTYLNSLSTNRFYQGAMENVAVYNYALSSGRISVHYQAGSTVSSSPPPTPTLSIQPSGTNVSLSWTNGFLQQASSAKGPWTDVLPTNETSPQVIAATNSQLFFRASSEP